jgi:hypothetical protein
LPKKKQAGFEMVGLSIPWQPFQIARYLEDMSSKGELIWSR